MTLLAEFEIKGLPKATNTLNRMHWAKKAKEAKMWKQIVLLHCRQLMICDASLKQAGLELTRFSSVEPDFDGLVSTWKHVIDGLVEAQVIIDDRPSVLKDVQFRWEKIGKKIGKIRVKIFSLQAETELSSQNQQSTSA